MRYCNWQRDGFLTCIIYHWPWNDLVQKIHENLKESKLNNFLFLFKTFAYCTRNVFDSKAFSYTTRERWCTFSDRNIETILYACYTHTLICDLITKNVSFWKMFRIPIEDFTARGKTASVAFLDTAKINPPPSLFLRSICLRNPSY